MNGDGFGAPPWGPADPVPELEDTQALPGLGSVPGSGNPPGGPQAGQGHHRDNSYDAFGPAGAGGWGNQEANGTANGRLTDDPAAGGAGSNGAESNGAGPAGPGEGADTEQVPPGKAKHGKGGQGNGDGKRRHSFWREFFVLVAATLVLAFIIKSFVVQAFWIPSGSMQNTLAINDRVLINKVVYHLRPIHRGDIIVFDGTGSWDPASTSSPSIFAKGLSELEGLVGVGQDSNIYIKRVIGLPGDHVVCCNTKGQITVNGVALSESSYLYPGNAPSTQKFNITVPAGQLWVMGDHRAISYDSRGHMGDPGGGTIPESGVLGRAFVIIWPPSQWSFLNIPATFEQPALNASTPASSNAAAGSSSAALESAIDNGTPLQQTASPVPLALGFVGAVPITWLQRKARRRLKSRRAKR